jgi:hypothetical protein
LELPRVHCYQCDKEHEKPERRKYVEINSSRTKSKQFSNGTTCVWALYNTRDAYNKHPVNFKKMDAYVEHLVTFT